ncbi:hypothetical protein [Cryptosporangium sp. NPDC048952]|uniref:hypothetical protein n=1 Tax=Cryptosporangium sp. NPDC048952 TaxID=3363961 RepID=UPI003723E327
MTARLLAAFREGPEENERRPLYARILCLRHVEPGKVLCALFFEGSIVVAMLLAFADLVSWWGVLATPAVVAAMVKLNDVVAGRLPDPHAARRPRARADVPPSDAAGHGVPVDEEPDTAVLGIIQVEPDTDATVPLEPLPDADQR